MRLGRSGVALMAIGLLTVVPAAPAQAAGSTQVLGWGRGTAGQVGDANFANRSVPVFTCAVGASDCGTFPLMSVTAVTGGSLHSLGLLENGTVLGWGGNFEGQLGDGSTLSRSVPQPACAVGAIDCAANPLSGATAVAAGSAHSLALLSDGTVVGWGDNTFGMVGDGTRTDRPTPVHVCAVEAVDCEANPLREVVAIAAGARHSLALLANGTVVAWGDNFSGQLGDGTNTTRATPVPVCSNACAGQLSEVTALAGGAEYTLALLGTGEVLGWGFNGSGQLGDGTTTNHITPAPVCAPAAVDCLADPLEGVTSIAAAADGSHNFALLGTGEVLSWGFNGNGELGDGTTNSRAVPAGVCAIGVRKCGRKTLAHATHIAAGGQAGAALVEGGTMVTWGGNFDGQLGDGSAVTRRTQPGFVCAVGATDCATNPLTNILSIGAGRWHFLAIRAT